jgi:hypothetical protein
MKTEQDFQKSLVAAIQAERAACANLALQIGGRYHDEASDPQADSSDLAGEEIAEAILARNREKECTISF